MQHLRPDGRRGAAYGILVTDSDGLDRPGQHNQRSLWRRRRLVVLRWGRRCCRRGRNGSGRHGRRPGGNGSDGHDGGVGGNATGIHLVSSSQQSVSVLGNSITGIYGGDGNKGTGGGDGGRGGNGFTYSPTSSTQSVNGGLGGTGGTAVMAERAVTAALPMASTAVS